MKYRIAHRTRYAYSQPVVLCHNEARLQPRTTARQCCAWSEVAVEPAPAEAAAREDFFGNRVLYFAVQERHEELVVSARSEVEVSAAPPPVLGASPAWDAACARLRDALDDTTRAARQFVLESPCAVVTPEVVAYARPSFPLGRPLLEAVAELSARIHRDFTFDPQSTTVATPPAAVLASRHGVCQDFAHLAIACLRALGLPARYVSGYLETVPPPGAPRLRGADVSHAWFGVFAPDLGWIDFDPTNDQAPADGHVTTAWGRDYADVTPLKGIVFGGGAHTLEVAVDMERIEDPPGG